MKYSGCVRVRGVDKHLLNLSFIRCATNLKKLIEMCTYHVIIYSGRAARVPHLLPLNYFIAIRDTRYTILYAPASFRYQFGAFV